MAGGRIILECMPALDRNGDPVEGALLYFYENETSTPTTVYADILLTTPLSNPVVANSAGVFPDIFGDVDEFYSVAGYEPSGRRLPNARSDYVQAQVSVLVGNLTVTPFGEEVLASSSLDVIPFQIGDETTSESLGGRLGEFLNPLAFGIVGDYAVNDSDALDDIIDTMLRTGKEINWKGLYRLKTTRKHTVDMSLYPNDALSFRGPDTGFKIQGPGHQKVKLDMRGVTSYPNFEVVSTGSAAYPVICDIGFIADGAGYAVGIGGPTLVGQEMNFAHLIRCNIQNFNTTAASRGLVINGLYGGTIDAVVNCGTGGYVGGNGIAMTLRQAQFCNFYGSYGSAETSIQLQDGTNAGNVFHAVDMENVAYDLRLVSGTNFSNTWVGGRWAYSTNGIDAQAGLSNIVINPNIGASGGATEDAFMSANTVGMQLITNYPLNVVTPAMPASGGSVTNNTGRNLIVTFRPAGATSIGVVVAGRTYTPITSSIDIPLKPLQTFTPTYTGGPPTMTWTAA